MGNPNSKHGYEPRPIRIDRVFDFDHFRDLIIKNRKIVLSRSTKKAKKGCNLEVAQKLSINEFNQFLDQVSRIFREFDGKMEELFSILTQVDICKISYFDSQQAFFEFY